MTKIIYPAEVTFGLSEPTLAEGCENSGLLKQLKNVGFRFEKTGTGTYVCMNVRQRLLLQNESQLANLISNFSSVGIERKPSGILWVTIFDRLITADYKRIQPCDYIKSCGL